MSLAEELAQIGKVRTTALAEEITSEVQARGGRSPAHALELEPRQQPKRTGLLFEFLRVLTGEERIQRLNVIRDWLRQELPGLLKRTPLRPSHFGFAGVDELATFVADALVRMEASAASEAEFVRGIKGWQSNFIGRVLFERLVKFHPNLSEFFDGAAKDFIKLANTELKSGARAFVNVAGKPAEVTGRFGNPRKVVEFKLRGADGVVRPFTDFGFIAQNAEGKWVMLPIEIKLPAAMGGVAGQFSEFLPRLGEAEELIALVADKSGNPTELPPIKPADLVFMQHDTAQMAVAPLSEKQFLAALASGHLPNERVLPADVGKVITVDQRTSPTRNLIYYHTRVLVQRSWLESIVGILTTTPK
jgi:hypothetical protein